MKSDIKEYLLEELSTYFRENKFPSYYAQQVFGWIYKKRIEDPCLMTNLSKDARKFLKDKFYFSRLDLLNKELSHDGTEKFLFKLKDGSRIESVLIPENKRYTLCISSQVGCKFCCRFCLSGKDGLKRNLTVSEIINQYLSVQDVNPKQKITNIVFMGTGEPLDNFSNVVNTVKILTDPYGLYFGKRRICISTCGLIPQIKKLAELRLGVKLSISLHSPDSASRTRMLPINKQYSLENLIKALKEFTRYEKYPITFEYVLIKGFNATRTDAIKLARLLKGFSCKVNLIPYNASFLDFKPPSPEEIAAFKNELTRQGIFFTLRKSRGEDIRAACGQLRAIWS
jgi:23S rRNA (adenine2503-C2)-methyltransferase